MSVLGLCITTLEHLKQNPVQREVGVPLACSLKNHTQFFFFNFKILFMDLLFDRCMACGI